jgi:hypothetical protein
MIDEGRKTVDERIRQMQAEALAEGHDNIHLGSFTIRLPRHTTKMAG